MKIIEKNTRLTCPVCGTVYEFEQSDIKNEFRTESGFLFNATYADYYVRCPICSKKYFLRSEFMYRY